MNPEPNLQDTQTRMAMAVAGLMMAHQVAGKAARDGIFLSQFSTTALPKIVVAAALVAVISSIFRGRKLVRVAPLRVTVLSFAVSGVLQAGEWLLLQFHPRLAAGVIYLHIVGFGAIFYRASGPSLTSNSTLASRSACSAASTAWELSEDSPAG